MEDSANGTMVQRESEGGEVRTNPKQVCWLWAGTTKLVVVISQALMLGGGLRWLSHAH